jgi:hypothetical protein
VSGDCTLAQGSRNEKGFVRKEYKGRKWRAHRLAWTIANGPIPDGMEVHHTCGENACVNVDHLYLAPPGERQRAAAIRGELPQQKKTHCPAGHEYSDENTYRHNGKRFCVACLRENTRAFRARHGGRFAR